MKIFCSGMILHCLIMLLFLTPVFSSDDWIEFGRTDNGNSFFYNKVNIERQKNCIVRVWEKKVYSDEGRKEFIQVSKKNDIPTEQYKNISYCLGLKEIDCEKNMLRILSLTFYDSNDKVILSKNYFYNNWENIIPTSLHDGLYKILCGSEKKPKRKE